MEQNQVIVTPQVEIVRSDQALSTITRSEIDSQIATAKKFPRHLDSFKNKALSMATLDQETAASCFYKLPRGGTLIEGPGIRLAEIAASSWGNLRVSSRVIAVEEKVVVAQAVAHDLETNTAMCSEVRVRITNKEGKRYNDDMIQTACNSACSKAMRNAIFDVVPFAYVKPIYEACRKVAVGDVKTLGERRKAMVDQFAKMGVQLPQILAHPDISKNSLEDVGVKEIETLIGFFTAIKDGQANIDTVFPSIKNTKEISSGETNIQKAKKLEVELETLVGDPAKDFMKQFGPADKWTEEQARQIYSKLEKEIAAVNASREGRLAL